MYKATIYIALSLFAIISNTYAEEPLIDRMQSGLGTIKFCIKQINSDPELLKMNLVYDRDIEQCKNAEVAIMKFANGLLSQEDVKRLQDAAFIRSELVTKIGGVDVVPGQLQDTDFGKKLELLAFCRKRCETVVNAQETVD